jgi:hypothetical protein
VYAINVGVGSNTALACRSVAVPGGSPIGSIDAVGTGAGSINLGGWAIDPDTSDPISVHVYVDSLGYALSAAEARSDLGAVYPLYGPSHGFGGSIAAAPGARRVCVYGINVGAGGNSLLGCRSVTVT